MNALVSLLPGLREARAPLISGYLWLLAVWLLFGSSLPDRDTNTTYSQLWEAFDAIGSLGLAAVASVGAYLLGSMILAVIQYLKMRMMNVLLLWQYSRRRGSWESLKSHAPSTRPRSKTWIPVQSLSALVADDESDQPHIFYVIRDEDLEEVFGQLIARTQEGARRHLSEASRRAGEDYGDKALARFIYDDGGHAGVQIPQRGRGLVTFPLPRIFMSSFAYASIRLPEVSKKAGGREERLRAEAEFREAIAAPLFVLVAILVFQVGVGWIAAFAFPLALLLQAYRLRRRGMWELVQVLHSYVGTSDLDRIAPVVDLCRTQTEEIAVAIEEADWELVPEGVKVGDNDEEKQELPVGR